MCAEGLGGAENRTQIAGILHSGQHHDQRRGFLVAVQHVRPGPLRRLHQRGDGLRRLGGQRLGKQLSRQQQNLGLRRQRQPVEQVFCALGGKDAGDAQPGA